jgi:hypothetical protein
MAMKNWLLFGAAILGILAVPILYSTLKGYTVWYWRNPHAHILVNGQPVPGYVHESKNDLFVTRGDLPQHHSYLIRLTDQTKGTSHDCGDWSASSFFVFVIGHVDPPCFMNVVSSETPEASVGPVRIHGATLEFQTTNGNVITVNR